MKLYTYDHCPYCVRARMIFGLKNVPLENIVLANDDEATPIGLVGQKLVPIVIREDGTPMGESLDIVRYVDSISGSPKLDETVRPEITVWLAKIDEYRNFLTMPRCTRIGFEEFATQSARDYFTRKKTAIIGDFAPHLADTPALLKRLHGDLPELEALVRSPEALNGAPSMEDILVFPILRGLSMVKGVEWTPKVRAYMETMSRQTHIPLLDDRAI